MPVPARNRRRRRPLGALLGDDAADEGPIPRTVSSFLPLLVACTVLGVACAARAKDAAGYRRQSGRAKTAQHGVDLALQGVKAAGYDVKG